MIRALVNGLFCPRKCFAGFYFLMCIGGSIWTGPASAQPAPTFEMVQREDVFAKIADAPRNIGPPDKVPTGRLKQSVKPLHYNVHLRIDPLQSGFTGSVTIKFAMEAARSGLWLHGTNIDVGAIALVPLASPNTANLATQWNVSWHETDIEGVNWVDFGTSVPAGEYSLRMRYLAKLDRNLSGLFGVLAGQSAFALAKSESIQARKFLPSFDEPGYKTPFDITLEIPQNMTAISNGALYETTPLEGGWKRVVFATTRPLPTYLLSVAVGDFIQKPYPPIPPNAIRPNPVPLSGYAQKGKIDQLDYALSVTAELVAFYERAFGLPYPYEKLDIIAAPAWPSGATELAGAITYRESRILLPENADRQMRHALLRLHTHELTHMWFGNLVTPDWWEDLWLKEAFASWGTPLALKVLFPGEGHTEDAIISVLSAMALDGLRTTRAVREPITDTKDVRSAYDAITYRKGMAIIAMMDSYFGSDIFRPALGQFLSARRDGVTNSADFFKLFRDDLQRPDMARIFEAYVNQPGLPLIAIEKRCSKPRETGHQGAEFAVFGLQQSRYLAAGGQAADNAQIWPVPICIRHVTGQKACTVFDSSSMDFPTSLPCIGSYHPNADAAGYFRFRLNDSDWEDLLTNFAAFSTSEALVAIDNGLIQFEDGQLAPKTLESLLENTSRQSDWRVMTYPLPFLETWYEAGYVPPKLDAHYRAWLHARYAPILRSLSGEPPNRNTKAAIGILTAFLIKMAEMPAMKEHVNHLTKAHLGLDRVDSANLPELAPSEYEASFQTLLKYEPDQFDALFTLMQTHTDTAIRLALASALGREAPQQALPTLLSKLTEGVINLRETFYLLEGLMANPTHRVAVWPWFEANLPALSANIPSQWRARLPELAQGFCNVKYAQRLTALFANHGFYAPGHGRALAQTVEKIQNCARKRTLLAAKFQALE